MAAEKKNKKELQAEAQAAGMLANGDVEIPQQASVIIKLDPKIPVGARDDVWLFIRGITPIIQHSTRGMVIDKLKEMQEERDRRRSGDEEKKVKSRADKLVRLPEEMAELGTYPTRDGRYFHPATAFLGSLLDGAQLTKAGYPGTRAYASTILSRVIRVEQEQAILVDPDTLKPFEQPFANGKLNGELTANVFGKKVHIDENKIPYGINFQTATNCLGRAMVRILAWRPIWKKWGVFVRYSYDIKQIAPEVIEQCSNFGGGLVGVGTLRPYPPPNNPQKGRGGPYGCYEAQIWRDEIPKECLPEL